MPPTGKTELMSACETGDEAEIARLLGEGADPNVIDQNGRTALFYLISGAQDDPSQLVELLVTHKANMNVRDSTGASFVDVAVGRGFRQSVQKVVRLLDASTKEGKNTIGVVIKTDDLEARQLLKETLGSKHFKYFDNKFRKKSKKSNSSLTSGLSVANSLKSVGVGKRKEKKVPEVLSETSQKAGERRVSQPFGRSLSNFDEEGKKEARSQAMNESKTKPRRHPESAGVKGPKAWSGWCLDVAPMPSKKGWLDEDDDQLGNDFTFRTVDHLKQSAPDQRDSLGKDGEDKDPQRGLGGTPRPFLQNDINFWGMAPEADPHSPTVDPEQVVKDQINKILTAF